MSDPTVLVTGVGGAEGSRAAAAALACAGAEPDRAALLVEVADGRTPRPTLVASAAARRLEERLTAHLPEARVASRGLFCQLALAADSAGLARIGAAVAVGRGTVRAVLVPPRLLQPALEQSGFDATAVLLCADLAADRALTALAARDLIGRGLRVGVLKRPVGWVAARRALAGALPPGASGALPAGLVGRLLELKSHSCYIAPDDSELDPTRAPQQQRGDHASAGPR
jgi:hypothetical protein